MLERIVIVREMIKYHFATIYSQSNYVITSYYSATVLYYHSIFQHVIIFAYMAKHQNNLIGSKKNPMQSLCVLFGKYIQQKSKKYLTEHVLLHYLIPLLFLLCDVKVFISIELKFYVE